MYSNSQLLYLRYLGGFKYIYDVCITQNGRYYYGVLFKLLLCCQKFKQK